MRSTTIFHGFERASLACILTVVTILVCATGCSTLNTGGQQKVRALAMQKYGDQFELIPNIDQSFILCIGHGKEKFPLQPIRFFIYRMENDSVVYERELENGTVQWLNASQLVIKRIPGNITGDEKPDAFTEIYDVKRGRSPH